jgi:transcriptional regulator with XRE-family HTH domain
MEKALFCIAPIYTSGLEIASRFLYSRVLFHKPMDAPILAGMVDSVESQASIGHRIRAMREALGEHNASAFAAKLGWTPQQLSNYENGRKRPEVSMAIRLCTRTGATLDYIYRGEFAGMPLVLANSIQDYLSRQSEAAGESS